MFYGPKSNIYACSSPLFDFTAFHRFNLCDLDGSISPYEGLAKKVTELFSKQNTESVRMVYCDADGDLGHITSGLELHHAMKDNESKHCLKIHVRLGEPSPGIPALVGQTPPTSPLVIPVTKCTAAATRKRGNSAQKKEGRPAKKSKKSDALTQPLLPTSSTVIAESQAIAKVPSPLGTDGIEEVMREGSVGKKIITTMLEFHALNILQPSRVQIAMFAGYSNAKSAGFAKVIGRLKKLGYVTYPNNKTVAITEEGLKSIPAVQAPVDNNEVHERIIRLLGNKTKSAAIFSSLLNGATLPKAEVALENGYTNLKSYGFTKAMSKLKSMTLIDYPDPAKATVELTDIAFPYGRPQPMGV
mmetsp:Transcript_33435/g.50436  ORF Transcript_33435/g.50436 Transcript_33435/m.50436 type:complete len:358 (-) Transcript_33435:71-1144(-)